MYKTIVANKNTFEIFYRFENEKHFEKYQCARSDKVVYVPAEYHLVRYLKMNCLCEIVYRHLHSRSI